MRLRDTLAGSSLLPVAALMLGLALPADAAPAPARDSTPAATAQASPLVMAAHRAAYRLDLDRARQGGDVVQAEGAMLFEVLDACDGWTTRQRLKLNVVDRSGSVVETSSDYSTWESKDGRRLRFTLTQMAQGAVTQRIAGEAELNGEKGGVVRYDAPSAQEVKLPPGTLLPMAHTIRTLELARAGQRMLLVPLFDGTSEDGAQDTTTLLSPWQPPSEEARYPLLKGQASARMRIAFFSKEASAGANLPEYEVGLRYYANGVADDMKMDFGDFVMNAVMQKLEPIPSGC